MVDSIAKTLGAGSGIDVTALVTSLVEAQFAPKTKALTARSQAVAAQISGIATLKSAITGFDAALKALVAGGTLASKLTSSSPAALSVTAQSGMDASGVSASVGVTQLASRQVSTTDTPIDPATAFRTGTLSLHFGSDVVDGTGAVTGFNPGGGAIPIEITGADATLAGIAAKINAADAGVTATVVTDGTGARLSIKGASGAAQAFEITAADADAGAGLSLAALAVGGAATGTTSATRARDAIVTIDGVRYARTSNTVGDIVPGVTMTLLAATTSPVAISMVRPTEALGTAVNDFVATYNEMLAVLKEQSNAVTGALRSDTAVAALSRGLKALTTAVLSPAASGPRTLADLGVATARDGTLSVNASQLSRALRDNPAQVEAMFKDGAGLSQALGTLTAQVTDRRYGFDAAGTRYARLKDEIDRSQERVADESDVTKTRLTRQFSSMDARVAAYKSTQTFLTQQIDAWNAN